MRGVLAGSLLALAACSGAKIYPNDAAKNLVVQKALDSGVSASLHIYQVDASCRAEYRGRVDIDRPSVAVGIPAGRLSYLVATFDTSSFFGGSSSTSVGALLKPRAGYGYELKLSYRKGIYDFTVRESDPGKGAGRQVARRDLGACTPGEAAR
jgi:hypothetical protein